MIEEVSTEGGAAAYIYRSKIIKRCPTCTKDYKQQHIKVVEEQTGTAVVHITCSQCKQAMIAVLGRTGLGVGFIGLATDLTLEDAKRLNRSDSFTEEDLLNFTDILHNNTFKTLFSKSI